MPGDVLYADIHTISYIRSESAFNQARMRACLAMAKAWLAGHDPCLLSLRSIIGDRSQMQVTYRGLEDISVGSIVGSAGRETEFTRGFYPLTKTARQKERWRACYTMTAIGIGYTPIEVYQIHQDYFVINGHHRVSVARYLGWQTIQAHVSELIPTAQKVKGGTL